jgi:hypothetical protein
MYAMRECPRFIREHVGPSLRFVVKAVVSLSIVRKKGNFVKQQASCFDEE